VFANFKVAGKTILLVFECDLAEKLMMQCTHHCVAEIVFLIVVDDLTTIFESNFSMASDIKSD
jgi:hypothetical protein